MFEIFLKEALFITVVISFPPLILSMFSGLFVGIIQAATQIQEQTISYVVKLFTIGITIFIASEWIGTTLKMFFVESLRTFPELGKM